MRRRILHLSAAAMLAGGLLFAQTQSAPQTPNSRKFAGHQQMWSQLNLTPDQQTQARTIFQDARQAAQPIQQQLKDARQALMNAAKNNSPDTEIDRLANNEGPLMAQLAAVHAKAFEKFYGLLTPEQRTKLNDLHMGAMMGGGMWRHAGRMHRQ